jgi:copper chaperone
MTLTFTVTGMHCNSCALLIDDAVEDVAGVLSSTTSLRTGRTVVDLTTAEPDEIIAAIGTAGYLAEFQTAR